ncbi:MAG: hypothetical protein LBV43_00055 [Prevotella sp.]|jgi:amino acid transporter|nr:hypothetical protein [Prevotella sp.]
MNANNTSINKIALICVGLVAVVHILFALLLYPVVVYEISNDMYSLAQLIIRFIELFSIVFLGAILRRKHRVILLVNQILRLKYSRNILICAAIVIVLHITELAPILYVQLPHMLRFEDALDVHLFLNLLWEELMGRFMFSHMLLCLLIVFVSRKNTTETI